MTTTVSPRCRACVYAFTALLFALFFAGGDFIYSQEPPPDARPKQTEAKAPALLADQRLKNVESFDMIWTTIRDKHFDAKLGGLDWKAVRDELGPKVERAQTLKEARAVMTEAIDRLGQTHFGIIPSDLYEDLENPRKGPGEIGLISG